MSTRLQATLELPEKLAKALTNFEIVAVRLPRVGDMALDSEGRIFVATFDFKTDLHVIVRERWKWPKWLLSKWIAVDEDGRLWGYMSKPVLYGSRWNAPCAVLLTGNVDIKPPYYEHWTKSVMERPSFEDDAK